MFDIDPTTKTIYITRGDVADFAFSASLKDTGEVYSFKPGDVIRFSVYKAKDYSKLVLSKDVVVEEECSAVTISLTKEDTTIGDVINKPVDYWYQIELNPDTRPQTLIGHGPTDSDKEKIFKLLPEGVKASE